MKSLSLWCAYFGLALLGLGVTYNDYLSAIALVVLAVAVWADWKSLKE